MSRLLMGLRVGLLLGFVAFGLLALGLSTSMATTRLLTEVEMRATARGAAPLSCEASQLQARCKDMDTMGGSQPTCGTLSETDCNETPACSGCTSSLSNWTCSASKPWVLLDCTESTVTGGCGVWRSGDIRCGWNGTELYCQCGGGVNTTQSCHRREVYGDPNCNVIE